MTKEQAIQFANCLKNNYTIDFNDMADFCDMAIKALEQQQPSEDCVSKQVVKEGMIKYGFRAPDMTVTEFVEDELPPVTPTFPKDATNGDVIMTIFPHVIIEIRNNTVVTNIDNGCWFSLKWWNAPYKRGSENE